MPTFSIVMPNYNYRRYLPESLGSVLAQTVQDFEVIISDDCSTDDSWDYITSIRDPRVSWHRNPRNQGISATINNALRRASGEFIVVLDPDDRYHPEFLQRQLDVFRAEPDVDICGTWVNEIDAQGRPANQWDVEAWFNQDFDLNDPASWIWQNRLAHGCAVMRKSAHDQVGLYDETLPITVDWNLWIRCLAEGLRFRLIPERLFDSRVHGSNVTNSLPVKMVKAYAQTSAQHLHPHLFAIGREDLVAANMEMFFSHAVVQETDLDTAGDVMAILSGDPVEGRALALAARAVTGDRNASRARSAPVGPAPQAPQLHLEDIREAEQARSTYLRDRALAAEYQLDQAAAANAELTHARDQLSGQLAATQRALTALRGRLPVRALAYANRQRIRVQQRRAGAAPAVAETPPQPTPARPAASVIVAAGSGAQMLRRTLASVVAQTMPDWELLIVDDGCDDPATRAVLDAFEGPRITVLRQERPGQGAARNAGAARSSGDFLVFLRPGEELQATYLEKVVLAFARFPDVDIICPQVLRAGTLTAPVEFDEHRIAYENTVPDCSALRRKVWEAAGPVDEQQAPGLIDWGFWRSAAAIGFHGWALEEVLARTVVQPGADRSVAGLEPALVIKQLAPTFAEHGAASREDAVAVREVLAHRAFHMPHSHKPTVVILVHWLLQGGGVTAFLKAALAQLSEDFTVVVVCTNQMPAGSTSAVNDFLQITPYVYDLPTVVGPAEIDAMVSSLMYRFDNPRLVLIGSPWAYANLDLILSRVRGRRRLVDIQFNHIGHLSKLLEIMPEVDAVLVAHDRLRTLLVDYYEVGKPVRVLYIAPPEVERTGDRVGDPAPSRLRIGWLGRNSPEKRPDLVAAIAAALPEADFVMAGSRLDRLPEQPANVHVQGWVPDAVEFLAGLDFILNTSDVEGISVTAMEALQLGVAVLTRDVGGMAELVRDGENGMVYSEADIQGLARRLRDPQLLQRIRSRALAERLPEVFHFPQMVQTLRQAILGP